MREEVNAMLERVKKFVKRQVENVKNALTVK